MWKKQQKRIARKSFLNIFEKEKFVYNLTLSGNKTLYIYFILFSSFIEV